MFNQLYLAIIAGYICGQVAQLVEQRTENPRVGGSIPPLATTSELQPFLNRAFSHLVFPQAVSGTP